MLRDILNCDPRKQFKPQLEQCPPPFFKLAGKCVNYDPALRPTTSDITDELLKLHTSMQDFDAYVRKKLKSYLNATTSSVFNKGYKFWMRHATGVSFSRRYRDTANFIYYCSASITISRTSKYPSRPLQTIFRSIWKQKQAADSIKKSWNSSARSLALKLSLQSHCRSSVSSGRGTGPPNISFDTLVWCRSTVTSECKIF